jgi:cytochrome P450
MQWLMGPTQSWDRSAARYGHVFSAKNLIVGTQVLVCQPEHVKEVFTGDPEFFVAGEANQAGLPLVGPRSILLLDGSQHIRARRLMLPPFHGDYVVPYARAMRDITLRIMQNWPRDRGFPLHPQTQNITLDVIIQGVLGLEDGPECVRMRELLASLLKRVHSPTSMRWMWPPLQKDFVPPWVSFKRLRAAVDAEIYGHLARRRAAGQSADKKDVLAMLMEATDEQGLPMSDGELRDEIITLLVAGFETSATAICWAFEEILTHPEERDLLLAELDEATGGGPLEVEHIAKLERLDAAVKEVMRLHPVVSTIGRKLKRPALIAGYELPAGVMVIPCAYLTHRLPHLYPEPEKFKPERFIGKKMDPYEWIPFGGGTRRCLGMTFALYEMKIVVATVLSQCRDIRLESSKIAPISLRGFLFAPKSGTRVIMPSRSQKAATTSQSPPRPQMRTMS